jgi:DNA helicase INO80
MGLGKTVQSIAFLCHIAEKYGELCHAFECVHLRLCLYSNTKVLFCVVDAWGPFLIISPASTLHNWQQEMARFVPDFKVVPYWGSPQVRIWLSYVKYFIRSERLVT